MSTSINSTAIRQEESGEVWFKAKCFCAETRSLSPIRDVSFSELKWLHQVQPEASSYYVKDILKSFVSDEEKEYLHITTKELEALERYHFNKSVEKSLEEV